MELDTYESFMEENPVYGVWLDQYIGPRDENSYDDQNFLDRVGTLTEISTDLITEDLLSLHSTLVAVPTNGREMLVMETRHVVCYHTDHEGNCCRRHHLPIGRLESVGSVIQRVQVDHGETEGRTGRTLYLDSVVTKTTFWVVPEDGGPRACISQHLCISHFSPNHETSCVLSPCHSAVNAEDGDSSDP